MTGNIFEQATRAKLRFQTARGVVGVEELWDFTPQELDKVYRGLSTAAKAEGEDSLMTTASKASEKLQLAIDIVKHIFTTKSDEAAANKERVANRQKKERLTELLAQKQDAALLELSPADLEKMIADLNA